MNANKRIRSIDALRGFDMIWILGAEGVFKGLFLATGWLFFQSMSQQFIHSEWHGFTFYDLIFPLFIFLSGVTLGIAQKNLIHCRVEKKLRYYKKAVIRVIILCALGIVYNHAWGAGIPTDLEQIRFASVLMRIALAWLFTALIVWHFQQKTQYFIAAVILVLYWFIQVILPLPGNVEDQLSNQNSWNAWVDQRFLPGISYRNLTPDPEGLLSQFPAIFNGLAGAFVGQYIQRSQTHIKRGLFELIVISIFALLIGYLWSTIYPLNKTLWTSSFALVSAAFSTLLLCFFYWLIDIQNFKKVGVFFSVIGCNSILLYLMTSIVNWQYIVLSLFGGIIKSFSTNIQLLITVFLLTLIQWILAYFLFKKRIFFKV